MAPSLSMIQPIEIRTCAKTSGAPRSAERGARALHGGVGSLLAQAPQDWQFSLPTYRPGTHGVGAIDTDGALAEALEQVLNTPTGARLVASGSALKAWQ